MHRKERNIYEKVNKTPKFKTEAEERNFWENHNSSDFFDWDKAHSVAMPSLKLSTKTISIRLSEGLLNSIKIEANKRDMPYHPLIKVWLANDVRQQRDR